MKRAFDILFSVFGLVLFSPVFLVVAILIKAGGRGPVFFVQDRVGMNFKPFRLYKFRTMVKDAEGAGPSVTASGDPRITGLGKVLRKTKLDELPQLVNVLKGDMSFVGPRPEVSRYVEVFRKEYLDILSIRPGITDYAAIAFSDEESLLRRHRDPEDAYVREVLPAKMILYKKYLNEKSLLTDLKIIVMTILKVIK